MFNIRKGFPGSEFSSCSSFATRIKQYFNFSVRGFLISKFGVWSKTTGKSTTGFTLVELLVVISIIGILSSVVFASLSSARGKARDAAVKSSVVQIAKLMELEYDDNGSYANLQPSQWVPTVTCANLGVSGSNYAAQVRKLCDVIVTNGKTVSGGVLYFGVSDPYGTQPYTKYYSIMTGLNSGKVFCYGTSGTREVADGGWGAGATGCWGSP